MSFVSVLTGIVDNDHKGETGIGTIHFVEVTMNGETTRKTWGLLDALQGRFNLNNYLAPYRETNKQAAEEARLKEQKEKSLPLPQD